MSAQNQSAQAVRIAEEHGPSHGPSREQWGSKAGFILAAVGSAVGLGNMWRFPYIAADSGGAAFVVLYILLLFFIGLPVLLGELVIGRSTGLSPIGAFRANGGKRWAPLGWLLVASAFLILAYYSVIAGWTIRYGIGAIFGGFPKEPGEYFTSIASGSGALAFHLGFMATVILIVMGGVKKGIERASLLLMPLLVFILIGIMIWAATLKGSMEGYAFYLSPSLEHLLDPKILSRAAGQAFFSLSLGMGAMLTYASYLSKQNDLGSEGSIIAGADFGIAFIAGLALFPIIAALGLFGSIGESTIGALFIALPEAFAAMGAIGRVVGILFFVALVVGALTSAISLLEVVTSSVIDELGISRKKAAVSAGILIALLGVIPALSLNGLDLMDKLAGDVFLVFAALVMSIFVGWRMKNAGEELAIGSTSFFVRLLPAWIFLLRFVIPPILLVVLYNSIRAALTALGIISS